jgi:LysM repeat protein
VRVYTVQEGDTLFDIAYSAGVPVADQPIWIGRVLQLNDLDDGDPIRVGMKLQLPASPKDASSSGLTLSTVSGTTSTSPTSTTYKVLAGDTLSSIADHFGVSDAGKTNWINAVLQLNSKDSPDALVEGESLKIPVTSGSQTGTGAAVSNVSSKGTYTVKPGDSLYTLADAQGIKDIDRATWIRNVVELNHLSDSDTLVEGQVLQLPPKSSTTSTSSSVAPPPIAEKKPAAPVPAAGTAFFTVQPGDNLFKIAARLGIPAEQQITWIYDVLKLNKLGDSTSLKEGSTLTMPAGAGSPVATATTSSASAAPSTSTTSPAPAPAASNSTTTNPATASGPGTDASQQKSCFYVVKSTDTLESIAKTLAVSASKRDAWLAQVTSLNGIAGAALPVGDALRLPC